MAIQFRRGNEADLVAEQLLPGEPAFSLDKKRFLIGTGDGVAAVPTEAQVVSIATSLMSQRLPVGAVLMWPGTTAPPGALFLRGQEVNRADYPDLWQYAQNSGNLVSEQEWYAGRKGSFSTGNGSTTFRLPDMKGFVPVGYDGLQQEFFTLGKSGGEKAVTLQESQVPAKTWRLNASSGSPLSAVFRTNNNQNINVVETANYSYASGGALSGLAAVVSWSYGGGGSHNNLQPYATVNFIIIAKAETTHGDIESALAELISQTQTARDSANQAASDARQMMDDIENMVTEGVAEAKGYTDAVAAGKVDKVYGKGLSTNDYTNEAKSKVDNLPDDTKSALSETNLRVAEIGKDLSDYKAVLSQLNPNQEAKQSVSDYGTVSLPVNAANGHMSAVVGGVTVTQLEPNGRAFCNNIAAFNHPYNNPVVTQNADNIEVAMPEGRTETYFGWDTDTYLKPDAYYFIKIDLEWVSGTGLYFRPCNSAGGVYMWRAQNGRHILFGKFKAPIDLGGNNDWHVFQFLGTAGDSFKIYKISQYEISADEYNSLSNDELNKRYAFLPYGTHSTVSAIRIVSESEDGEQRTELYIHDCGELRSVPNGTADEISGGQLIQRVKTTAITADNITGLGATGVNADWVVISKPIDYIGYGTSAYATGTIIFGNYTEKRISTLDLPENINCISSFGPTVFYLVIPKGTYADLNAAKTALAGTKLTYQLAEPIITPINVSGTLLSYPKGTVFAEPVLPVAGIYADAGITVTNTNFPIGSIERIYKIDFATGVETEIDPSSAVVSGDGLSFTHPDLTAGDIVFFTYYHSVTGTNPKLSLTYYDSRYTVKDSVNNKFYKWKIAVANGVPSISVEEVS